MPLYRATTPTHTFVFDDNPETAFKTILVSYEQNGAIILEKGKEDMVFGAETDEKGGPVYTASVTLSQREVNLFTANKKQPVYLQIRALTNDGDAKISEIFQFEVQRALNDEVLT